MVSFALSFLLNSHLYFYFIRLNEIDDKSWNICSHIGTDSQVRAQGRAQKGVSKAQGNEPSLLQTQSILLVQYNCKDLTKIRKWNSVKSGRTLILD